MAQAQAKFSRNHLLTSLSPSDLDLLRPHLEPIVMATRHSIEDPNATIKQIYFMEEGIASVVSATRNGTEIEIGLIGCEGMSGMFVLLGNHQSPYHTYIQVSGRALRMNANEFRKTIEESKTLRAVLLKYVQAFTIQTAHTAIANARATVEQRLARWALMAHDRLDGDDLPLTHEFLSLMLGVRRAGVTVAVHALQNRGLLNSGRGRLTVLDRKGLEKTAGGYYGVPESELRRLMR